MDRARHRLGHRRRGDRGRRPRLGRLLVRRLRLGHWRRSRRVLRLGRGGRVLGLGLGLSRSGRVLGLGRRLLILRLRRVARLALRLLRLILLRCLLSRGGVLLRFGYGRKLAGKDRLGFTGRGNAALLRVKRKIELDTGLAAAVLGVLAGIERSGKLLKQRVTDFDVAFVVRLICSGLACIDPKRRTVGAVGGLLLLLRLGVGHGSTGRG